MKIFEFNKISLCYELVKPSKIMKLIIYIFILFIVLFIIGWYSGTNNYIINKIIHKTEVTDTVVIYSKTFSEKALIELLQKCNTKYPYIVLAQAKIESGNFTSELFRKNHNMFGMKQPKRRVNSSDGEQNGYAYYRDWVDCVYDYNMYQLVVMCEISTEEQYLHKLSARYAEDTSYVIKLKNIINNEKLKYLFED